MTSSLPSSHLSPSPAPPPSVLSKEEVFWRAATSDNVFLLHHLLTTSLLPPSPSSPGGDQPTLDINWQNPSGWSAFWIACSRGSLPIIQGFLRDPRTDLNRRDIAGQSPFKVASYWGRLPVLRLLLEEEGVDVNLPDYSGETPLWAAACNGHLPAVKMILASGRELRLGVRSAEGLTAAEKARIQGHEKIALLIEDFQRDPVPVVRDLRRELALDVPFAAKTFSLIVFTCDGYLRLKEGHRLSEAKQQAASRFISMVTRLPMELQMILSNRLHGLRRERIGGAETEAAMKDLSRTYLRGQTVG